MKFITLLLFPLLSFAQVKPDKTISLFDNRAELLAPKELSKMSDEMWSLKYHTLPKPALVLTDKDGEVNLLADLTNQPAADNQIAAYKDFRVSNLKKTRTDVKILDQGAKTVNGKAVSYIKFTSQAADQVIFNYYFFAVLDGKILFLNFNCIEKLQATWEKTADEIFNSLKIKKG